MRVHYFKHNVDAAERASLQKALDSHHLTTGQFVSDFETAFANHLSLPYSVGLTSGTGALHLALIAAGVGPGDEVITTPLSFVATSHAILMAGATPVFVDVEVSTGNMDVRNVEKAITKQTKAIIPVHLYGQMADMKALSAIAKKYKLVIIEDAAHAVEAVRDGLVPGAASFGACFSFYATKSLTSGEGGAFVTKDARIAERVKRLRLHGVTRELHERDKTAQGMYDVIDLGWKYNMDNIQAALLLPQVKKIKRQWKQRAQIADRYREAFADLPLFIPETLPGVVHAHHLFPMFVDPKKRFTIASYLKSKGIGISLNNYPPIHLLSYYRKNFGFKKGDFPNAEYLGERVISLPLYGKLSDRELAYVIKHVTRAVTATRDRS